MRTLIGIILLTLFAGLSVSAQAVDSGFAWGRDYTFERMTATRLVNDAEDKGEIRLVAYVYRPVKKDRHKVVLFSHGSCAGLSRSPKEAMDLPPGRVMILCTGSQGEPMSALTRIAYSDHQNVEVERGDTVIISAKPVPGNELRVHDSINRLARLGAQVLHEEIAPVHVSGHACSEELRTLLSLVRPKALMPIHGEYRMLAAHAQLGRDAGIPASAIVIAENGSVVELTPRGVGIVDSIPAGVTFVDGLGVGDVQDVALRDRRRLSEDGVLIVVTTVALGDGGGEIAPPELIARGVGEDLDLIDELREEAERIARQLARDGITEIKLVQEHIHDGIGQVVYDRTRRRPMILPIVIEV